MTLREIFDQVIIKSGQFLITTDNIEMQEQSFLVLLEEVLGTYSDYSPVDEWIYKNLLGSREYIFSEENTPTGIPELITECIPIRIHGVHPFALEAQNKSKGLLEHRKEYPFEYRKPKLYVPVNADYDLHVVYNHKVNKFVETTYEGVVFTSLTVPLTEVDITLTFDGVKTIDEVVNTHNTANPTNTVSHNGTGTDVLTTGTVELKFADSQYTVSTVSRQSHVFFTLLTSQFLKSVGKSRRNFTLNDLPIVSDAADMVADAKEMEEKAMEDLQENHSKFYLAWGN